MRVVQAQIQTVEEIYRLVWTAVSNKQPIEANYQGRHRLFGPHRLGRNGKGNFAYCATHTAAKAGAQPAGSPANWRCVALEKLSRVKVSGGCLAHSVKSFTPCLLRWPKPTSTRRISPSAIRKKDIEEAAQAVVGQA